MSLRVSSAFWMCSWLGGCVWVGWVLMLVLYPLLPPPSFTLSHTHAKNTVNRTCQMATGRTFPFLLFLHVLSKPSMGLWDSLVYGSVSAVLQLRLKLGRKHKGRGGE